jgi:hypothetical protein
MSLLNRLVSHDMRQTSCRRSAKREFVRALLVLQH